MPDVNLVPKEYKKTRQLKGAIFSKIGGIILALLILSLLLYSGLLFYFNKLNKNLENINQEISSLDEQRDAEKEQEIIDLDSKMDILRDLFRDHLYWTKLLSKIEELTKPETYFLNANITSSDNIFIIAFKGNVLTYTSLAKQMVAFQEEPFVAKVDISGISLSSEGGIDFNLDIRVNEELLLKEFTK